MRFAIIVACAVAVSGCDTINWSEAAGGLAAAGCNAMDKCTNVCPDGAPVDYRFPNCDSPVRSKR